MTMPDLCRNTSEMLEFWNKRLENGEKFYDGGAPPFSLLQQGAFPCQGRGGKRNSAARDLCPKGRAVCYASARDGAAWFVMSRCPLCVRAVQKRAAVPVISGSATGR